MARYKYIDTNPRFLAVDLAKQLLPEFNAPAELRTSQTRCAWRSYAQFRESFVSSSAR